MITDRAHVPCNGCTLCCRTDAIVLLPEEGDDVTSYETQLLATPMGTLTVLKKKDGHCIYLVDNKCSIWDRAPKVCRVFDCRALFASKTRAQRRDLIKRKLASKEILEAGRQRLDTLL